MAQGSRCRSTSFSFSNLLSLGSSIPPTPHCPAERLCVGQWLLRLREQDFLSLSEVSTSRRQVGPEPQAPGTPGWRGRTHVVPLPGAGGARPPELPSPWIQAGSEFQPPPLPAGVCPRRLPRPGTRRRRLGGRRQGAAGSVPPPGAQSQLPGTGSGYSPCVSGC